MNILDLTALLIVLAGLFGSVNYLFLRLPAAIGILIVALATSLSLMLIEVIFPSASITGEMRDLVLEIDFADTLLQGMLGLLLFAGALHVKLDELRERAVIVAVMATLGVGISTAVAGYGFHYLTGAPILVALVFGALISPTDPVAVMGVLREANLRKSLEVKIAGESLFNDGVGYVVFLLMVGLAFPSANHDETGVSGGLILFAEEAGGGALLGAVLGWLTFQLMKRIDDHALEVLLSLGLVAGGYALAAQLHFSGPIMAVVAGLFIGDVGMRHGMSEQTRAYVTTFWELIDEILNAVLFLLIGVEVFALAFSMEALTAGVLSIGLSLIARLAAVAIPVGLLAPFRRYSRDLIPIMTWGGLKGGISVALALSLPDSEWKPLILTSTYVVVVFSIIVQGLTVGKLARYLNREQELL
ncbi:MAG TPA: sodium:proton antiporter [Paracoccaceae bacterium]|nr:sodium:proton antiporter [Paracoccaceae bacterium]